jgi:transcriptional regulator with XRE-family HTH domain
MGLVEQLAAAQLPPPGMRKSIRETAGASLRDIGSELGVTPMTVLRWERGEAEPRRDRAIAYRALLDALNKGHLR